MAITDISQISPLMNFRELGGYSAADGRHIKSGLFYRSAALGEASEEEFEFIKSLGLRFVLDLRSEEEALELPDPLIPGAQQVRISGAMDANDNEVNLSPANIVRIAKNPRREDPDPEESIIAAVEEIYTSLAFRNEAYKELVAQMEAGNVPLLFHCTAGKDRTGIAAMVIMMILGASDEDIVSHYVLTNEYLQANIEKKLADHPLTSKIGPVELLYRASEGVIESFGRRVLSEIRQEYGTLERYLEAEYGLAGEELQRLRDQYLE